VSELRFNKEQSQQQRSVSISRPAHLLAVNQLTRQDLRQLFLLASELRSMTGRVSSINILEGKILVNVFYEPSTRTNCSFQSAMKRLGGDVVNVNVADSSVTKGESLSDTIRTLQCYGDALVLRHPGVGSAAEAAKVADVPIINAGDGTGEHPTQALLDIYTIREELGTVNGLTVTLVGDLKHGRTCHSLARLLKLYNVTLNYVTCESLRMPDDVKKELSDAKIAQNEYTSLSDVIASTDVLYVTRIQEERFASKEEYENVRGGYVITPAVLQQAKTNMIIMHPLPRVDEISREVDYDQRAAYFRQMKYGLWVRMALLAQLLGKA
jgi:carbamoyl-phosphate synthase/aspartate carbamoyltransferase